MPRLRSVFVLSVSAVLLAGCATVADDGAAAPEPSLSTSPSPSATATPTKVDVAAVAKADSWLEGAVLPSGAVPSESTPASTYPFSYSYYAWPCSPMETRTAYWTIAGADVIDTANWLKEHPTAGLNDPVPIPITVDDETEYDTVTLGNVPEPESLEGIAYTVNRTANGVAVRAEIGVFREDSVCPEPPDGGRWGGPGQG
ncbi:hypothetical protein [Salinibacterium sp. SWN248]|uniref:hypothetical protein n=1 Tax=Salinibacterium sp. SWN248 TaxID=2792056 RepID=UPI0018CFAE33|nr:hypothetical protein [Salinibacterium sp. SWN248]MBH0022987.1 hypothetical protein [Salinibacterium sp. SWN248]